MKKMLLTLLVFLYLGTSSGFAMYFHYCMDDLIGASLVETTLETCENCGMDKSSSDDQDCCKEEYKQLKVDSTQNVEDYTLLMMQNMGNALPPLAFDIPTFLQLATCAADYPLVNSPPQATSVPTYLRNCVFRI